MRTIFAEYNPYRTSNKVFSKPIENTPKKSSRIQDMCTDPKKLDLKI